MTYSSFEQLQQRVEYKIGKFDELVLCALLLSIEAYRAFLVLLACLRKYEQMEVCMNG